MATSLGRMLPMRFVLPALCLSLVLPACKRCPPPTEQTPPECPTLPEPKEPTPPPPTQSGITVQPFCALKDTMVRVFVRIDTTYVPKGGPPPNPDFFTKPHPAVWDIACDIPSSKCVATQISLTNIQESGRLTMFDTTPVQGMIIAARTGSVFTLKWGPHRTITVDLGLNQVQYRESSATSEGTGTSSCDG